MSIGAGVELSAFFDRKKKVKLDKETLREAMFYKRLDKDVVQCEVCFRGCIRKEGQRSFCRNKINIDGKFYSLVHSRPSAVQIDPIEKEPAYHMFPGTEILCFGTAGCNFRCKFCQNWHLSQRPIEEMDIIYELSPEDCVDIAIKKKIPTLSFTYNEPTSFYEYVYDIAKIAKEKGLHILFHSNGSMNPEPLKELLKYADAVTIDLKGFTKEFYKNTSSAKLAPVLGTLKIIKEEKKWLEIVNLHIPGLNDNPLDIKRMCRWIKEELGDDVPLHFSRFFPNYRLTNITATPIKSLEKAHQIARDAGLKYVTIGNVPGHKLNSTFCPNCQGRIIHRTHFQVLKNNMKNGKCIFCGYPIAGLWEL
ncbi:MAG: AmmeMemoRadiSam system radical SAM enzyme [Candidatus Cloacimonadota bacterium]|nr:MAG: AmmeMemoRadiSam system radical SAM enzyme [Candidatus Cloacimonadota bacterium]